MKGILTKLFVFPLLFVTILFSFAWAGSTEVTIIYSNDVNGQIDPIG